MMIGQILEYKYTIIVLIIVVVLGGWLLFVNLMQTQSATVEIIPVGSEISNRISISVEVVDTPSERRRGLSGRELLPQSEGMLFLFDKKGRHGIWMKDMNFPIDIIWIANGVVADIEENAVVPKKGAPDTELPVYMPDVSAEFVLEVNAGFVASHNIRIGDAVRVVTGGTVIIEKTKPSASAVSKPISEAHAAEKIEGYEYFIETLIRTPPSGTDFTVGEILAHAQAYDKYLISYKSGDFTLSGTMTVPRGPVPEDGFPVLILNHGLIYPSIYYSGRGSRREKDFFGRNGYVTIHQDYRGYGIDTGNVCPPTLSMTPEGCRHDFYVGYTLDVINVIDALRRVQLPYIDLNRIGMWGHSMGGGMAARVAVLRPDIRAYVLFAPISADAEDNFYELKDDELSRLAEEYGTGAAARQLYDKMSPIKYFSDIVAPVQLHHGTADEDVPIRFSDDMFRALKKLGKTVEFFTYPDEPHEFIKDWDLAAERSLQFFDLYVKNAR